MVTSLTNGALRALSSSSVSAALKRYLQLAVFACLSTFALCGASHAQSVIVESQELDQDTVIGLQDRDLEFRQGATIVTNGYKLDIIGRRVFGNNATVITFATSARDGVNGSNGVGAGGHGSDGEHGSDGRSPRPILVQADEFVDAQGTLTVAAHGQDGGNGGNGGNGVRGAPGANGRGPDVSDCWFGNCRRSGSDGAPGASGGNSGRGGNAGAGGDGGTVIIAVRSGDENIIATVDAGQPGQPGTSGNPGAGGPGGRGGNGHLCCGGGRNGPTGPSGSRLGDGALAGAGNPGEIYRIPM